MRKRWYQKPLFHDESGEEKKASWIELFYDLVFVAAFIQLGNGLADNVSVEGVVGFFLIFIPLWVVWTGQTYFFNRFTLDDIPMRLIIFFSMFCIGTMAVSAPYVFKEDSYFFSTSAALCFASVAICNLRAYLQVKQGRDYTKYWATVYGIAALFWFIACWVPKPYEYLIWALGVMFVIAAPFSKASRSQNERYPLDREHLSERYGIFTIIVLGEAFVKVVSDLSHHELSIGTIIQASFALTVTCAIWWLYFDDVAGTHLKKDKMAPLIWLYGHLPLQAAITATGVALYKVGSQDLSNILGLKYRWLICVCLALVLLSIAVIDFASERRHQKLRDNVRINIRAAAGLFMLLMVPIGGAVSGLLFVGGVLMIIMSVVLFDMIISPFEQASLEKIETKPLDQLSSSEAKFVQNNSNTGQSDPTQAIIKGAPNEMRHDVYSFFMEGGWTRLFVSAGIYFLIVNVCFASLYLIDPVGIMNASEGSFLDAFFFSVQTFSTIGYGNLNPVGSYANALVTIEAAVGLLSVAMITGIIFAKASKPKSAIMFTNRAIFTKRDGVMNLVFRLGNARGSEVVDASLNVSVVMDHKTQEGEKMRRLYDLKMVRSRTPLFRLSWTAFHIIDEKSPLYGINFEDPGRDLWAIIATVMGHEGTYGQTVYARNLYRPDDIVTNARFSDVLSQMQDGQIVVDFDRFHSIEPLETA